MTRPAAIFLLLIIAIVFNAPAQNKVVRDIDPFDKAKVSDNLKVTFIKSDREKITIVTNNVGYDKVVTESSGRELRIKMKTGVYKNSDVQIEVEYVTLRSLEATNNADVKFSDTVKTGQFSLKATGGAVINIKAELDALEASLSNGGRIEISGSAELQEVDANLGSKYHAYEFETENGFVKSNTNSDMVVWVKNRLEASAGSKAELKYRGKPADVKSNTSLGGKISGDI